jgi:hypothetical protein
MSDRDAHIRVKLAEMIARTGADMAVLSRDVLGKNHAYIQQYLGKKQSPQHLGDEAVRRLAAYFDIQPSEFVPGLEPSKADRGRADAAQPRQPSEIDEDVLINAIIATRAIMRTSQLILDVPDEARLIAETYQELLATRKPQM